MFDIVNTTLAAEVADNGTFTVAYPTDRSAGMYAGGYKHKMFVNQSYYEAPAGFTVSFGASEITVTWKGDTTLAANTPVALQFDRLGDEANAPNAAVLPDSIQRSPLHLIQLGAPDTADDNGICESQTVTFATTPLAVLDGAYVDANGVAVLDVPRNVVAAWTGTAVLTVTGKDEFGNTIVEASGSGTSLTGKKAFKKITSASFSANVSSATVGTGDVLGLPVRLPDASYIVAELKDGAALPRKPGIVYLADHMLEAAVDAGTSLELVSPVAGRIRKVTTIARGTITTGGAITVEVNTTAVDGLSVVVADGAAAGDVDSDTPTAAHATAVVAAGDRIEVIPAAGFNASADIFVIIEIETTGAQQLDGTFVAAVDSAATSTTGDVRGTYDPSAACNGSLAFGLLVALADPADRGVAQYAG
jgi:hypothetical protein